MARTKSTCDYCRQNDDHPRHVRVDQATDVIRSGHFDCCGARGCEICRERLLAIPALFRHGTALIDYLTKGLL